MKKAMLWIAAGLCAVILIVGICLAIPSKTLDFRGVVTRIEVTENGTVYHIEYVEHSQLVLADEKTELYRSDDKKTSLSAQDVQVGDTIEGNYRRFTRDNEAKFIRIWE